MATEVLERTTPTQTDDGALLRTVLRIDGVACVALGIAAVAASAWLPPIMGAGATAFYAALGIGGGLWGAWLLRLSGTRPSRRAMLVVQTVNLLLLIDCIALLISGWFPLSTMGFWTVFLTADALALMILAYFVAMRRAG
jgi:hypothetical protein